MGSGGTCSCSSDDDLGARKSGGGQVAGRRGGSTPSLAFGGQIIQGTLSSSSACLDSMFTASGAMDSSTTESDRGASSCCVESYKGLSFS